MLVRVVPATPVRGAGFTPVLEVAVILGLAAVCIPDPGAVYIRVPAAVCTRVPEGACIQDLVADYIQAQEEASTRGLRVGMGIGVPGAHALPEFSVDPGCANIVHLLRLSDDERGEWLQLSAESSPRYQFTLK
jgi:hypothetical protein